MVKIVDIVLLSITIHHLCGRVMTIKITCNLLRIKLIIQRGVPLNRVTVLVPRRLLIASRVCVGIKVFVVMMIVVDKLSRR